MGPEIALALGLLGTVAVNRAAAWREARAETTHPPLGRIIEVDGTALHLSVEGSGPPLILLHGAGGNLRDFAVLMPDLLRHYTVIRFDRPGLGYSCLPARHGRVWHTSAPSPVEQARLMARAYDTLGLPRAVVAGVSYGGAVALAWGLERPDQVAALALISAVSQPWPGDLDPIYRINSSVAGAAMVVPMISALHTRGQVDQVLERIFTPQSPPPGYAGLLGTGLSTRRRQLRANARQVHSLRPHMATMAPRYGELALPVELVHGEADQVVPLDVHAEPTARALPDARLTRLAGIGHMPHHVAPAAVLEAIDRAASRAGLRPGPAESKITP